MKVEWKVKKLGDISTIELGRTPSRANKSFWDEELKTNNVWLSIADLLNTEGNVVSDSKEYLSDKGAALSKTVLKGTLLVSFKLTLGRLAFAGRDLFTNEAIAALSIFDEKELSKEFLFYFLHYFDWRKAAENDAKIKGMTLNKAKLKELLVHFPSSAEQQRIVAVLDQAFEGIAKARTNAEQNLQNARALFENHLQSVFTQRGEGWEEKKLGEVVELDKTQHKPNSALPYVGMEDIESDTGNFIGSKEPRKVKSSTFHFNISHVLYGRLRPYLNKVLLPDFEGHCSTEVFPILPSSSLDRRFLFYWLTLNSTKEKINATCTGARMPRANMNDVLIFDFSYPSLNTQKTIVENLKELSKETQRLEALYQRKITLLDELKKSLLQQAFAGEL